MMGQNRSRSGDAPCKIVAAPLTSKPLADLIARWHRNSGLPESRANKVTPVGYSRLALHPA
jgi:hypothetical protein